MSLRRIIRLVPLFIPLVLFVLLLLAPRYSVRWSMILQGHPFARVIPKEQLDIFQYVSTDHLRSRALVFSGGTPIGWIYQTMSGFARFVPFSHPPSDPYMGALNVGFTDYLLAAWSLRWWLLVVQALLLLFWIGLRKSSVQQSHPSEPTIAERGL
jgi:hypothetical protein